MQSDFICWFLLTLFVGVCTDKITVTQDSLVLLFENVTADNVENEVSLFVNGVEDPTLVVTFKIVNGHVTVTWKSDNYTKIFMDAKRNICIANVDETYQRKYYIQTPKRHEVELTILKTNYSTTMRTTLKETIQKADALPDRSSETGYGIASVVLMVIMMGIILVVITIVVIVKRDRIFAWIQCKRNKSVPQPVSIAGVPQPVQVISPCDSPNSTSYQLMWNKPDDEYLLKKYILRYCEISSNTSDNEQFWPFLSVNDILPSTESYMLKPLSPGRYYQVEIQAVYTQGQSSSQSFRFKTKESVPQPVEVTSQHDSPDSTSYQLMWNKPDDGGSQLLKYNLRYREVETILNGTNDEPPRPLGPFLFVDNILPSAERYSLNSLKPGRYYQGEIQAVNTQGQSSASFYFKTKEGAPKQVDTEVQTDFRLQVPFASYPTPTAVTDESNSKTIKLSTHIVSLQPRNNDAVNFDLQTISQNEQNANPVWDKGPAIVESPDLNSDDECSVPFLKDQGLSRPMM